MYKPLALVVTWRTTPVAVFLIKMVALGITAPLASATVPDSVAPATWAAAAPTKTVTVMAAITAMRMLRLVMWTLRFGFLPSESITCSLTLLEINRQPPSSPTPPRASAVETRIV